MRQYAVVGRGGGNANFYLSLPDRVFPLRFSLLFLANLYVCVCVETIFTCVNNSRLVSRFPRRIYAPEYHRCLKETRRKLGFEQGLTTSPPSTIVNTFNVAKDRRGWAVGGIDIDTEFR